VVRVDALVGVADRQKIGLLHLAGVKCAADNGQINFL
jgi:hypothetical protein